MSSHMKDPIDDKDRQVCSSCGFEFYDSSRALMPEPRTFCRYCRSHKTAPEQLARMRKWDREQQEREVMIRVERDRREKRWKC